MVKNKVNIAFFVNNRLSTIVRRHHARDGNTIDAISTEREKVEY